MTNADASAVTHAFNKVKSGLAYGITICPQYVSIMFTLVLYGSQALLNCNMITKKTKTKQKTLFWSL